MAGRRKKRKKRKIKLTPEQRRTKRMQRSHRREVRGIFDAAGFIRIASVSDKELTFRESTSDFDDVFVFENVVALVEYTTAQESGISAHLKNKKILYDKVVGHPQEFVEFLDEKFPDFKSKRSDDYALSQMQVVIVYCSFNAVSKNIKQDASALVYLDYHIMKYFAAVAKAVKKSVRYEFLHFLNLDHSRVGPSAIAPETGANVDYAGSLLPEEHSHFRRGFKVVSFYVDPGALLSRCYVLRKDGWSEKSSMYQRMIDRRKIESIRKYLLTQKRVFINNIIVTLPSSTKLLDSEGNQQDPSALTKTSLVKVRLPRDYNSIGLVDGQHRVFSYYEGGKDETQIRKLRQQQNLLATGLVYPPNISEVDKNKFEAMLFLEINSTQTNAKSDIKQAIGLLLRPFDPDSIAKEIVNHLNEEGPLASQFERYFYERGKLKTTSVVSYGVKPAANPQGVDSLFKTWKVSNKERLAEAKDEELLKNYIEHCVTSLNVYFGAVRASLPKEKWTPDKKLGGLLTTTIVNGFIVCLREIIANDRLHKFEYYRDRFSGLAHFSFKKYRSSQYGSMGRDLYAKYFAK